jgi:hypothetical protein
MEMLTASFGIAIALTLGYFWYIKATGKQNPEM